MRTLILAATALAFLSSSAFAQEKAAAPAATGGDAMSKSDTTKMAPKKAKKVKRSSAKASSAKPTDDATKQ
jgi:hypothetical protein